MADQKINELPTKTAPSTGDKILMIGSEEEYQIDYDQLASAILDKLATKQYSELDTTAKTVLGALDELNGKSYGNIYYYNADTDFMSETARSQALIQALNKFKNSWANTYIVIVIRYKNGYYFTYIASMQSAGNSFHVLEYSASYPSINIWNVTITLDDATIFRHFSDDATFLSYHNPTTASDFNEMRSIGAYWINPSVTTENHPSNAYGMLEVMGGMQRFTEYDKLRRIFVRFYENSQWTSWVSFDHS